MQKSSWYVLGIVILLVALGLAWHLWFRAPASYMFELTAGETVSSWNFQGVYTGNSELETRAHTEINRLKGLYANKDDDFTDYEIHISFANQYHLLGDGKNEYAYLMRALALDSEDTGLAWNNLGVLLEQLGAHESARIAFEHAVQAQAFPQYVQELLSHLMKYFPKDQTISELKAALGQ